jgi:hypothetical protein
MQSVCDHQRPCPSGMASPLKGGGANTYINRNELDQCINQLLFNKFVIKQYLFLQNGNIAQVHTNTHT